MTVPTLADVHAARDRIKDAIYMTPCARSETLSQLLGCELYLKLENLQITGSFKERGALNKILQLIPEQMAAGVIAASAGNHAQGVAHVARKYAIPATIVMPETTPLAKIHGTRALGATIILHGSSYDEAYDKAVELQQQQGTTLIHAFDDTDVIAGQGTIGLELLQQLPDMDMVVVPVGGGGLIAGIALAIKQTRPAVQIIGVEAERMPAMQTSLASGKPERLRFANTIADGISVAKVGHYTLPIVKDYVSGMVTVTEEQIALAIMTLLEQEKTLAEGAGAVGFAALHYQQINDIKGKKVVVIISGGNIDMTMLARILERGLQSDGRLARLKVIMPDKPGNIAELAALIAEHHANILEISQNRSVSEVELGETEIELLLEARGWQHVNAITDSIRKHGYHVK
jgi:threonine dehydratase